MRGKTVWLSVFLVCLVIAPAIFLGFQIFKYSVNVPFGDQWNSPGDAFEGIYRGTFSIADLFSQHNEHRIFFPRLIFITLAYLTHWDTRYEVLLTFLLACITSLNIYHLTRLSIGSNQLLVAVLAFVSNLLIFSPIQYENWLWGFQSILLFPMFYITSCLLVLESRLPTGIKLLSCTGLSIASSFSLSNGLFCWVAFLAGFIFSSNWTQLKRKRKFLLFWFSGFLSTLIFYFYKYQKPANHPSLEVVIDNPYKAIAYFFSFLGSPLTTFNTKLSESFGFALFSIFFVLCLCTAYRFCKDGSFIYRTKNWLIIGLFVLASAAATTISRSGFGVEQALAARYTSFSVYLIVSVIHLSAIIAINFAHPQQTIKWMNDNHPPSPHISLRDAQLRLFSAVILTGLITSISIFSLLSAASSIQFMQAMWRDRLYAKTCLTFVTFVDDTCITESLFPDANFLKARAEVAESMGFIEPDLAQTAELDKTTTIHRSNPQEYGFFDGLTPSGGDRYVATGWAILPYKDQPANAVLLTYKQGREKPTIFAVAPVRIPRPNLKEEDAYLNSGWGTTFSTKALPSGDLRIDAWAFDIDSNSAYKLKKAHKLQN